MKRTLKIIAVSAACSALLLSACERVAPPVQTGTDPAAIDSISSFASNENEDTTLSTPLPSTASSVSTESIQESTKISDTASEETFETEEHTSTNTSSEPAEITLAETTAESTSDSIVDILGQIKNPSDKDFRGTIVDPFQIGETASFDGYDTLFDPFRAEVTVQQVHRGAKALQMIKDASTLNPSPEADAEYLVAQVLVKITASKNSENVGVSPYYFSLAREDGRMYGDVTLFRSVTPVLSGINVGETSIGYICFQVDKSDKTPYIVFLSRAHGGLWFSTDTNVENNTDNRSRDSQPNIEDAYNTETDTKTAGQTDKLDSKAQNSED